MNMDYYNVSEYLDILEAPFHIPKPNKFKIINMDLPLVTWTNPETGEVKEEMVYCMDLIDVLTQEFFSSKGSNLEESPDIDEVKTTTFPDRPGYKRVSSSLWKQREEYCAALIQKAWKVHKKRSVNPTKSKKDQTKNSEEDLPNDKSSRSSSKILIEVQSVDKAKIN
jgi:voltage-gated sodium channel type II alpha